MWSTPKVADSSFSHTFYLSFDPYSKGSNVQSFLLLDMVSHSWLFFYDFYLWIYSINWLEHWWKMRKLKKKLPTLDLQKQWVYIILNLKNDQQYGWKCSFTNIQTVSPFFEPKHKIKKELKFKNKTKTILHF